MQAMWKVLSYLKHWVRATSIYGAHSPFLFTLFNEVFQRPFATEDRLAFDFYRKAMLNDTHSLRFEEHGAGNNQDRLLTIAEIARKSSISGVEAQFLINLTRYLNPVSILELGTSTGVSTKALRIAAPEAKITTVEGCNALSDYTKTHWDDSNTEFVSSTFDDFFEQSQNEEKTWDLIYIDGNHTLEATLAYYNMLKKKHCVNNTCLIFDDIYWSKGMNKAWKTIYADTSNTLTLDLFKMGVVFFDHKLSKQHFSIKI